MSTVIDHPEADTAITTDTLFNEIIANTAI